MGLLMFFIIKIRPNIIFSIMVAACFTKNPSHPHTNAIKTIFYYLKKSMGCSIIFSSNGENLSIEGYLDSN